MKAIIYINLPVSNLTVTNNFFSQLGLRINPKLCNENAICMIINESVFAMFLTKGFFKNFTNKEITDAFNSTEVILTINKEIKSEVDEMVNKAISLGAKEVISKQDFGFIYSRCFQDLDGHIWEVNWTNGEIFN